MNAGKDVTVLTREDVFGFDEFHIRGREATRELAQLAKIGKGTGRNLGLGIVQHLSDTFTVENQGTSLIFDFQITPEKQ